MAVNVERRIVGSLDESEGRAVCAGVRHGGFRTGPGGEGYPWRVASGDRGAFGLFRVGVICLAPARGYSPAVSLRHACILGHRARRAPRWSGVLGVLAAGCVVAPALGQVRVVTYNITDLVGSSASVSAVLAAAHADDRAGFAVPVGAFLFCEVRTSTATALLNLVNASAPPGYTYALATFTSSSSEDQASGAQALVYRTDLLAEIPAGHMDIFTGGGRNTDRWLMRLVGYDSLLARFYMYGSHLKASTGSVNVADRLAGVQAIRSNADALGPWVHTLYAGDMNFYTSTEDGYQAFLAAGNGIAVDPIGGGNWTGVGNAIKHTQSPRDITGGGLVGGGMDDRFDFILPTAAFMDGDGLSYINGTYRAFGNDGQHYNLAINAGNNFYFPGDVARSNALAANLFAATDHIPVIADFRVPAKLTASAVAPPSRVIRDATGVVAEVRVSNTAAGLPVGIAPLAYAVSGTGVLAGAFAGTAPLAPAQATLALPVATNVIGLRTGTAAATTSSEAAQNPSFSFPVSVRVLRPSNPTLWPTADLDTRIFADVAEQHGPPIEIEIEVANWQWFADQARLDVDAALVQAPGFSVSGVQGTGLGVNSGLVTVIFDPTGLRPGLHEAPVTILTSDEDVPGETTATVVATLRVTLEGTACAPADINCSGVVDGADLGLLLANWGLPGAGDINSDGVTNGSDLGLLLASWGQVAP